MFLTGSFHRIHQDIMSIVNLDTLIIGGGIAGLWTLDRQVERGLSAGLIESGCLGQGQSISAQGILHGGTKYALSGLVPTGAREVSSMPERWARSLSGDSAPDLSETKVRASECHLWRTDSVRSIVGMVGAKVGLSVTPSVIAPETRPAILRSCPGDVALLPERVIEMPSVLETFRRTHEDRLLHGSVDSISRNKTHDFTVQVLAEGGATVTIHAKRIVLSAGRGNESLLQMLDTHTHTPAVDRPAMQLRPLHMAMVRGTQEALPELNGHCVDGGQTRVTITSSTARNGDRVWQLGGRLAEEGCKRTEEAQWLEAKNCLGAVLPDFDADSKALTWATYRVDRAEHKTRRWARPDGAFVESSGGIIIVWPTKMVLAPNAAKKVDAFISDDQVTQKNQVAAFANQPTPNVAHPPWETAQWS